MDMIEHGSETATAAEPVNGQSIPGPEIVAGEKAEVKAPPAPQAEAAPKPGADNVDRIRDILFGANMREYDRRFAQLEERLLRAAAESKDEISKRLTSLEAYVRKEVETLSEDIRSERGDRTAGAENLGRTLTELTAAVERKTQQLSELATRNQRELRQQMLDQHTFLVDEDRRNREELYSALTRHFGELHDGKVDRFAMADLFSEVSARLKGQFRLPAPEGEKDGGLPG